MEKRAATLMVYLLLLAGCEYENEEALFGDAEKCTSSVLFEGDIRAILQTNCTLAGCHAAGGTPPELTTFERAHASAADILHLTQSRQMPPPSSGISLSEEEIDMIACWVEQGAMRE